MARQLQLAGISGYERDYRFHPTRKWEMDFAWPTLMVYLEIEGGEGKSRHRSKAKVYRLRLVPGTDRKVKVPAGVKDGFAEDCQKHSEAAIAGWLGVRVTASMISSGQALVLIKRAIESRMTQPW